MAPGCIEKVRKRVEYAYRLERWTPAELYPEHMYRHDTAPVDIRDWMDYRRHLVDVWKSCYEKFRREFTREQMCHRVLHW
jgi:hypothetical protein